MDASHEDDDDDDGDGDVLRDGRATKLTPLCPSPPANRTEINCGLCKWATLFASNDGYRLLTVGTTPHARRPGSTRQGRILWRCMHI